MLNMRASIIQLAPVLVVAMLLCSDNDIVRLHEYNLKYFALLRQQVFPAVIPCQVRQKKQFQPANRSRDEQNESLTITILIAYFMFHFAYSTFNPSPSRAFSRSY